MSGVALDVPGVPPAAVVEESAVMRKVAWRLVPLLVLLYVVSYIDRVNIGFAALTMNRDIGLDPATFGLGAGIFFIGYCLFEVPSNVVMVRFGARRWIARILFTWGLLASGAALVRGPTSFLVLRFLLGVAEAGFFPAVIFYLGAWFPARYRARVVAAFSLSIPLALAIGAPASTALLRLDGLAGWHGWQWLFLIEGLPAILLTFVVLRTLPDMPAAAAWLSPRERRWLAAELAADAATASGASNAWRVLLSPGVIVLCLIYFCATASNIGLSMFLPQIVKQLGFSNMATGWLSAIPYVAGSVGLVVIGHLSDRAGERRWHLACALLLAAAGLALAGWYGRSAWSIAALALATVGILGCKGPFWALPSAQLSGPQAALAIALINSLGNLGGFFGPSLIGFVRQGTDSFGAGLYVLAAMAVLAAAASVTLLREPAVAARRRADGP